jgi:thiosulfate dehydrogenase
MSTPRPLARLGVLLGSLWATTLFAACGDDATTETRTPEMRGEALFRSKTLSPNAFNPFSCAQCHAVSADDTRQTAGANLAGVTARPTFWGGTENDLLDSVNVCLRSFMSSADGLSREDPRAGDLYSYLSSLGETPGATTAPAPFTVVVSVADLPNGDATRGAAVWGAVCQTCHGAPHTAVGQLDGISIVVPEETIEEHEARGDDVRLIVIEKVRHGNFLGYSGRMPPFSLEKLSDQELSDVLSYLGLDR